MTFACSYAQRRLWFVAELEPLSAAYNMVQAFEIREGLNEEALRRALDTLVARHESLRTTFTLREGEPAQQVHAPHPAAMEVVDVSREALRARIEEEAGRPFDLARGPLFRCVLYRLGDAGRVLLLATHHIVSDGWSLGVLFRELVTCYDAACSGESPALPDLAVQYADYACWQRDWLKGEALEAEVEHWRGRLAGAPQVLDLPTDHPRSAVETHRGASVQFRLSKGTSDALAALGRREGATFFMTLLAAFGALLSRLSGQKDLLLGSTIAGRQRAELEGVVGLFANTLVLRADLSGNPSFRELLARARETALDAYAHTDVPFEKLVEALRPARDLSRNPLFQVLLVLQDEAWEPSATASLDLHPYPVESGGSQFDLSLYLSPSAEGLQGSFQYSRDLFDAATIERWSWYLEALLTGALADPDRPVADLPLLGEAERSQLAAFNATAAEYPSEALVDDLIEAQASQTPDAVAVVFGGETLSYRQLDADANRLARHLVSLGVARGTLVGLCVERSPRMLVALLGILKAGGAYVPLDPSYPAERLAFMVGDSGMSFLVTEGEILRELGLSAPQVVCLDGAEGGTIAAQRAEALGSVARDPQDPAYVIYTSGSTGKPKGVLVPHRAVVNFLSSMARTPGLSEADTVVAITTLSFDISVLELLLPLAAGARVVIAGREDASDGIRLRGLLDSAGATVMQATPSTWRLLLEASWQGSPSLRALCGGEALPRDLAESLLDRTGELWNMYGPTETTVWSTCDHVERPIERISIGRPIANTQVHVLDDRMQPALVGVPGELYIGGDGVALGYLNRPELTAERFVPDPFRAECHARLYRTGDLGRWLADGTLECLGRIDNQVKVRGYRIELGEIEVALAGHESVEQAVVVAREMRPGDTRLVAYLLQRNATAFSEEDLRRHLRAVLPTYMVPQHFVVLPAFPLTPSGKVDRKALPPVLHAAGGEESPAPAGGSSFVEPRTPGELLLARLWSRELGVPRVGVHDNFFDLGGHSLLSVRIVMEIESQTGRRLSLMDLVLQNLEQLGQQLDTPIESVDTPIESAAGDPAPRSGWLASLGGLLRAKRG